MNKEEGLISIINIQTSQKNSLSIIQNKYNNKNKNIKKNIFNFKINMLADISKSFKCVFLLQIKNHKRMQIDVQCTPCIE